MNKLVGIVIAMAAVCGILLSGSTNVFAQSQDVEQNCKTEDATEKCTSAGKHSTDASDPDDYSSSSARDVHTSSDSATFQEIRLSSPVNEANSSDSTNAPTEPVSAEATQVYSPTDTVPANDTSVSTESIKTEATALLSSASNSSVQDKSTLHQFYQIARGQAASFPSDADSRTAEALAEGFAYERVNQVCGPVEQYQGVFSGWLGTTKCDSQDNPAADHGVSWICNATATVTCNPKSAN
jgi:hypothetical protein